MALDEAGNPVGQIRFDRDGDRAEIDIAVSPAARGKGVGTRLLKEGCRTYLGVNDVEYLLAEVNRDNTASIRIFEAAGFETHEETVERVRMKLRR